ncbi:recombination regulator RecX [Gracilibacillus sp. YIM 98692]|uniref:recombination regulator RecX n=1 Tax=Gracilibacillus sp. YIM 98692 TaxID=2663532 RepID=UPI0013D37B58|nr:recombination regulator RecX [Gracilibacillus sp. YIM 98692]
MLEISRITTQKKSKHRYNIYLSENGTEYYGFSVDEDLLIQFQLRKGLSLSNDMMESIKQKDASYKAYTLSLHFLSYRMRSEKELTDYLQKKDIPIHFIDEIVQRLKQERLLDDRAFSEALVRTRINTSNKGPLLVKKELLEKGISAEIAEHALYQYSFDKQYQKVEKWMVKKLQHSAKKSYKQQLESVKQSLLQKGFTQDVIAEAIENTTMVRNQDTEYQAIQFQGEKLIRKYARKETGYVLEQKVKAALFRKGFDASLIEQYLEDNLES